MAEGADSHRGRAAVGRATLLFFALIVFPAMIYGFYVFGQMEQLREHNLRRLDTAASSITKLLQNAGTTLSNLSLRPDYSCTYLKQQTRMSLDGASCKDLERALALAQAMEIPLHPPRLEEHNGELYFASELPSLAPDSHMMGEKTFKLAVRINAIIDEIPLGDAFDQILIVGDEGKLVGDTIAPKSHSLMLPPGEDVSNFGPALRILDLQASAGSDDGELAGTIANATLMQRVELAGQRFDLTCQPLRLPQFSDTDGNRIWQLCGLTDSQKSFRQSLQVAPHVVIILLALITLAIISWPMLKVLSLAAAERIRFSDFYLILIAHLALVMLLTVGIADIGSYWQLRERSLDRLDQLSQDISVGLQRELEEMYQQLQSYDQLLAALPGDQLRAAVNGAPASALMEGCMLLPPAARQLRDDCQSPLRQASAAAVSYRPMPVAQLYPWVDSVFWMRPCDGQQFFKLSSKTSNTPPVKLGQRSYFQAIANDAAWRLPASMSGALSSAQIYAETSASVTTGAFFAALSAPSLLSETWPLQSGEAWRQCGDNQRNRFAVAITGRLESLRNPVLAPGVGFAVIDASGKIVAHSDRRRAVFENLLSDRSIATRLRAAMMSRQATSMYSSFQTRPHQLFLRPVEGMPWWVLTYADGEILRSAHIELLVRCLVVIASAMLLALFGTFVYMIIQGREPPVWIWPRREPRYRPIYLSALWCLMNQCLLYLILLDALAGWMLLPAALLIPIAALCTVVLAANSANKLNAKPRDGDSAVQHRARIYRRQRNFARQCFMLAAIVSLGLFTAMLTLDPVASANVQFSDTGKVLAIVLGLLLLASGFGQSWYRRWLNRREDANLLRHSKDPLLPHIAGIIAFWVLVGALPAYGLYKLALFNQMTVWMKQDQTYLGRALAWRYCELQDAQREILHRRTDLNYGELPSQDFNKAIYEGASLSRKVSINAALGSVLREPLLEPRLRQVASPLIALAPIYNETTLHTRYLDPFSSVSTAETTDHQWWWQADEGQAPQLVYQWRSSDHCGRHVAAISAQPPLTEPHFGPLGWIGILAGFALLATWSTYSARKLFFGDIESDVSPQHLQLESGQELALERHLGYSPDLLWARAEIAAVPAVAAYISDELIAEWIASCSTRRAVIDLIIERAGSCYEQLWNECSAAQKLLLVQLIEEEYANPKQAEVVRSLLKIGLLRRDPVLRPVNHSFAVFAQAQMERSAVKAMEREGSSWVQIRKLLLAAMVLVFVFLSFTQQDIVEVWVAYLGTAAAGATGLMKVLGMLNRSGEQKLN